MYMLSADDDENTGVFALENEYGYKMIYFFEEEEDAERYLGLLEADDYPPMRIVEITKELAIKACQMYNYQYYIVKPTDFVIPPKRYDNF